MNSRTRRATRATAAELTNSMLVSGVSEQASVPKATGAKAKVKRGQNKRSSSETAAQSERSKAVVPAKPAHGNPASHLVKGTTEQASDSLKPSPVLNSVAVLSPEKAAPKETKAQRKKRHAQERRDQEEARKEHGVELWDLVQQKNSQELGLKYAGRVRRFSDVEDFSKQIAEIDGSDTSQAQATEEGRARRPNHR
jgi:uncharacterized protein YdaT